MSKELHDAMQQIEAEIVHLVEGLTLARTSYCNDAIAESGTLAHLLYTGDHERREVAIKNALLANAQNHDSHRAWLELFIDTANGLKFNLLKVRTDFREAWNGYIDRHRDDLRQAQHETSLVQMKVRALQERRREHAIHSPEVRAKVWAITDGRCIYCDVELTRERDPNEPHRCFEVDHIVPKASGGPDHISNYVPSCSRCNCSKSDRSVFQFLRQRHTQPDLKVVGGVDA